MIPNEDLLFFAEFDGLDSHAEGWRRTAAYQILNDTPTGLMIEDLMLQILKRYPVPDISGPDLLLLAKHVAKSGLISSVNSWQADAASARPIYVLVFRKAFSNKEVRPIFARLLQALPAAGTKTQQVVKLGHKLIMGKRPSGSSFAWWVEETKKDDLIVVIGPAGAEDIVLETLEGKRPSVLTNPARSDLLKADEGFEKTGSMLIDPVAFRKYAPTSPLVLAADKASIARVDFASGFQNDALATVTRLHLKNPDAAGKVAFDQPTFEKATIPSIPASALGMMVLALDPKSLPEQMNSNPQLQAAYTQMVANLKSKAKVRFEEDILAQLGPKVTAYLMPPRAGSSLLPNALSLLSSLGGPAADSIPKGAILVEVNNATAFSRTLDELMGYVNRQLKVSFSTPPGPGNEAPPPPPGGPRGRGLGAPPAPEFRVMGGETKSYVFTVPPELSSRFPAGFRPTIRLGQKQVAIAPSADGARQALEAKGNYVAPAEIGAAFGRLPSKLSWLLIVDPRESTPEVLASLPGKLQAGINSAILPSSAAPNGSVAAPAGGNPAGDMGAESRSRRGGGESLMRSGAGGSPGMPAASSPAAGASPASPTGPLVLQVDPSKLPAVEDTRRFLFPAIYTIDGDKEVVRFTSRAAFPPVLDPAIVGLVLRGVLARINPNGAAPVAGVAPPTAGSPVVPPAGGRPTPPPTESNRAARQGERSPSNPGSQRARSEP